MIPIPELRDYLDASAEARIIAYHLHRLAVGDADGPCGLEGIVMALSGDEMSDGSIAAAITRLADSNESIAEAQNRIADALFVLSRKDEHTGM